MGDIGLQGMHTQQRDSHMKTEDVFSALNYQIGVHIRKAEKLKIKRDFFESLPMGEILLVGMTADLLYPLKNKMTQILLVVKGFLNNDLLDVEWVAVEDKDCYEQNVRHQKHMSTEALVGKEYTIVKKEDLLLYMGFYYKGPYYEKTIKNG